MDALHTRIRTRREKLGMSQDKLAELTGYTSRSSIAKIESGRVDVPRSKIAAFARALRLDPAEFVRDETDAFDSDFVFEPLSRIEDRLIRQYRELDEYGRRAVKLISDTEYERCIRRPKKFVELRTIPFYALEASAGTGEDLGADNEQEIIKIPKTNVSSKADYVIRVHGNSMEPDFQNGDLILVAKDTEISPGQLGVFALNGDVYFKKMGDNELISLNSEYAPIPLTEGDTIRTFGKVLGKTKRFG